jgi:DNA-binding MarR family transcriptional regulator
MMDDDDLPSLAPAQDDWKPAVRSFTGLLTVLHRLLNAEFHRRMDAVGFADVRHGSGKVFEHLGSEGSTIASMARRAGVSAQALVQVVDELQDKGYVERVPSPGDRRAKLVRLTGRGVRLTATATTILEQMETEYRRALGTDRFSELRTLLEELHDETVSTGDS